MYQALKRQPKRRQGVTKNRRCNSAGYIVSFLGDDAASVNWGAKWRMPNLAEIKELFR